MTDQNPAAVATRYFGALAGGDIPAAMALFSPDVVWHQPGANPFSGAHHGPDGVGALLGGIAGDSTVVGISVCRRVLAPGVIALHVGWMQHRPVAVGGLYDIVE